MAYRLTYGDGILFDPYTADIVYDAKLTAKSNNPDYLDFTVPYGHALYGSVCERGAVVRLEWDGEALFVGEIESIDVDIEGNKEVACVGALDWLGDTVVRPYSTLEGEQPNTAPSTVDGLFAWYVDQHNAHILDDRRRFSVGVNQGWALDENNHVYRSSEQLPTTWDEISEKIVGALGGYVTVDYGETCAVNLYADVHETNAQVIDFGVNITDFSETTDTADMYTAVRAVGEAPDKEEGSEEEPQAPTLADLPDGKTDAEGIYKLGDVVYSADAVSRYGYRECAYSDNDCTTAAGLLTSAVKRLQALMAPSLTVTVKAVDLALYMDGYDHLKVGQAVRVRSAFHGVDEYLMVSSATVDLQDPGNTEYTLGAEYSTLTGQQSGYLKTMNGSINSALDATAALSSETKAAAKAASDAASAAETAQASADTANDAATKAQSAADTAQQSAEKAATDAAASLDQAKEELSADATAKADAAQKAATEAAAQDATTKADQAKASAIETAAADATEKADAAQKAAEEIASADATAKADAAVATAKTYADAQIKVASDSITSTVSETYETKTDAAATKTQVTQNADSITTLIGRADSLDTLIREGADGIEVGKSEDGSTYTGYHTLVGIDSFQIHDAEHNELARFGESTVKLAETSVGAKIEMCGNQTQVYGSTDTGVLYSKGTTGIFTHEGGGFMSDSGCGVLVTQDPQDFSDGETAVGGSAFNFSKDRGIIIKARSINVHAGDTWDEADACTSIDFRKIAGLIHAMNNFSLSSLPISAALSSFYCCAYQCPSGVVFGANSTGYTYQSMNSLCVITTTTKFANRGTFLLRGVFSTSQSGLDVAYQSDGHSIILRAEQQVAMSPSQNLLHGFIPCAWTV